MPARVFRITAALILFAGMCLSQQGPSFYAQTNLVTVPFQVRRGSRSVDLKPSDVVLLEDGVTRSFTVFEKPPEHLTLDLVVMFDVTRPTLDEKTKSVGFWDAKALEDLANYWNEAAARRLLDGRGTIVRFSIYRFDQSKLQRLGQSIVDPKALVDTLHRLPGPITDRDVEVPLPTGLGTRTAEVRALANGRPPEPSSLAAALAVLKDSAARPSPGAREQGDARALVIFSTGAEGTSITPQDLANQAVNVAVPVYPVALPATILPYDGYGYDGFIHEGANPDVKYVNGPLGSMWGPGGAQLVPDHRMIPGGNPAGCQNCGRVTYPYLNYPFELLGSLTGGLCFEAVNHAPPAEPGATGGFTTDQPGETTRGLVVLGMDRRQYSMSGRESHDVLERVKQHALARFSSSYTIGFVPAPSESPQGHKLEVKLAPKTSGKVIEGQRNATY
jgi:hypothetical protein